jgi:SAM-dependent methyltransferase
MQVEDLDFHYRLQAEWLGEARAFLFRRIALARFPSILDFGCGTGVISEELRERSNMRVTAIDRNPEIVAFASRSFPGIDFINGDEDYLISRKSKFDLIFLNFVLLWQQDPVIFLEKLKAVLHPRGTILIAAEPDYGARIDHPEQFGFLKDFFAAVIRNQLGDPLIGRKLHQIIKKAGLRAEVDLFSSIIVPTEFDPGIAAREWRIWGEWGQLSAEEQAALVAKEGDAIARGERLILAPIFYAICRK